MRCKGITAKNKVCTRKAMIVGYCTIHFKKNIKKRGLK